MVQSLSRSKWWAIPTVLIAPMLAVTLTVAPSVAQEATPAQTVTFNYTGGAQSWTVPADVHQVTFDVYGAQGGDGSIIREGAKGGRATATMPVQPGQQFVIMVGGRGADYSNSSCITDDGEVGFDGQGGFNGGANSGLAGSGCSSGGGGGASDVRLVTGVRVVVAGGGGGASGGFDCGYGGGGGGLTGGSAGCVSGRSGTGGNQDGSSGSGEPGTGSPGSPSGGGGGGGGYYGGAGGAGDGGSSGGGGGSGFGPADTVFETGVHAGNGVITVAFGETPTVTSITPAFGPASTLSAVDIRGTNFVPGATGVLIGDVPSIGVSCLSTTLCAAVTPPGSGTVDVRVTANGQLSLDTPADDYTYLGSPTITSISPTAGPHGTVITIEGTNFFPPPWHTDVIFDLHESVAATCTSFTICTVRSPPGLGIVDLYVSRYAGLSNTVQFTRTPGVTSISPNRGPTTGDTAITITGTGFDTAPGGTAVNFGSAAALAVGCASATTCTAVSPPGSGTVNVLVTVSGVQSVDTAADDFTYEPPDPVDDLAALESAVQDAGRAGRTLARLAARAGDSLEDGRTTVTCARLRAFLSTVRIFGAAGRLTPAQVEQFTEHATRIRTGLGCR
jgi:Glycine rich protein/IPT/TIG domain